MPASAGDNHFVKRRNNLNTRSLILSNKCWLSAREKFKGEDKRPLFFKQAIVSIVLSFVSLKI